jgi:hypothetical protein
MLFAPVIAAFLMYSLVWVEERYIGSFVVLFWTGLMSYVCLPVDYHSQRLIGRCSAIMLLLTVTAIGPATAKAIKVTDESSFSVRSPNPQFEIAVWLARAGLKPWDRVAVVGHSFSSVYWARLAKLQIVADVPETAVDQFWSADPRLRSQLMAALAGSGVTAIVAEEGNTSVPRPDWQRVGKTKYYFYLMKPDLRVSR